MNNVTIFDKATALTNSRYENIYDILHEIYVKDDKQYLAEGKLNSYLFSQGVYFDGDYTNVVRRSGFIKRWSGVLCIDIDIDKNIKELYKENRLTDKKFYEDRVSKIFDYVSDFCQFTKYSVSGLGIHGILIFDLYDMTDEDSKTYHKKAFNEFYKQFTDFLCEEQYLEFSIDKKFNSLSQLLSLSKTKEYKFNSNKIIPASFLYNLEEIVVIAKDDVKDVHYNEIEIKDLKEVFDDLIKNIKPDSKISGYENRFPLVNGLVSLGYDIKSVETLIKNDKKNGSEYVGYFNTAKSRTDLHNYIKSAYYKLKSVSKSKLKYDFKREALVVNSTTLDIRVNQYLEERFDDICDIVLNEDKSILQAPTGSGKSVFSIKLLRKLYNEKKGVYVLACDTVALAEQTAFKNDIQLIYSKTSEEVKMNINDGIFVSTYDSLKWFKEIDFLIVDEAHQLVNASTFRENAIKTLEEKISVSKTLLVTATPQYMFHFIDYKKINIGVENRVQNNIKVVDVTKKNHKDGKIIENTIKLINHLAEKDKKGFIYINSVQTNNEILKYLSTERKDLKVVSINTKLKDDENFDDSDYGFGNYDFLNLDENQKVLKSILEKSIIPDDVNVVLTTCLLQNGINILNDNIDFAILDETEETSAIQFAARFRKGVKDAIYLLKTSNSDSLYHQGFEHFKLLKNIYDKKAIEYTRLQVRKNTNNRGLMYFNDEPLDFENGTWRTNDLKVCYKIYENNRRYFKSYPVNFFHEEGTTAGFVVTNIGNIDEVIKHDTIDSIKANFKDTNKKNKEFYFEEDNCIKIHNTLKSKTNKLEKKLYKDFYKENKNILDSKAIEKFDKKYSYILKMYHDFKCEINTDNIKVMVDDNKPYWFYPTMYVWNFVKDNYHSDLESINTLKTDISVTNYPRLQFLTDLHNELKEGEYTWDRIKEIISNVANEFKSYKIVMDLVKSNNGMKFLLECIFDVNKITKNNKGKRTSMLKLKYKDLKNNDLYKSLYNRKNKDDFNMDISGFGIFDIF